jgi:hypothetical protein
MKVKALIVAMTALGMLICGSTPFGFCPEDVAAQERPSDKPQPRVTFTGGSGESMEKAVIIQGAPNSQIGVGAEYYYLEKRFGERQVDWKLIRQSLRGKGGKYYDLMQIELKDGTKKDIYFDITDFFGKK